MFESVRSLQIKLHGQQMGTLVPAYDLVRSSGFNGNHTITIAGSGLPKLRDVFNVSDQCGLDRKKTQKIFDEVFENSAPSVYPNGSQYSFRCLF